MKSFTSLVAAFSFVAVAQATYYGNHTVTAYPPPPAGTGHPVSPPAGTGHPAPPPPPSNYTAPHPPPVYTTATVSSYVTVCPSPTTFTYGTQTYTVSTATTITITNCPCTISYTATPSTSYATYTVSTVSTYCPSATTIITNSVTYSATTPGYVSIPVITTVPTVVYPSPTTPITLGESTTPTAVGTVAPPTSSAPAFVTGNAGNQLSVGLGAMIAGGLAILL